MKKIFALILCFSIVSVLSIGITGCQNKPAPVKKTDEKKTDEKKTDDKGTEKKTDEKKTDEKKS